MKLLNYIFLILILLGIVLFFVYRGNMRSKIDTANMLKEEWRSQYLNLLNANVTTDTVYKYDTTYITNNTVAVDSVYVHDTVEVCNYIRTYRDSIVKPNFKVNYSLLTRGILLDSKFKIVDTRPKLIEKRVIYKDKIIEVPENKWRFYGILGYNFDRPSAGILALSKGRLGFGYKNYFNDTHEFLILYKL